MRTEDVKNGKNFRIIYAPRYAKNVTAQIPRCFFDIAGLSCYYIQLLWLCGRNSVVECQLPKLDVGGSNPLARSTVCVFCVASLKSATSGYSPGIYAGAPLRNEKLDEKAG